MEVPPNGERDTDGPGGTDAGHATDLWNDDPDGTATSEDETEVVEFDSYEALCEHAKTQAGEACKAILGEAEKGNS